MRCRAREKEFFLVKLNRRDPWSGPVLRHGGLNSLPQGDDYAPRPCSGGHAAGGLFGHGRGGSSAQRREDAQLESARGGGRGRGAVGSWGGGEGGASSGSVSSASSDDMWSGGRVAGSGVPRRSLSPQRWSQYKYKYVYICIYVNLYI